MAFAAAGAPVVAVSRTAALAELVNGVGTIQSVVADAGDDRDLHPTR
jgi:hypothetical protein